MSVQKGASGIFQPFRESGLESEKPKGYLNSGPRGYTGGASVYTRILSVLGSHAGKLSIGIVELPERRSIYRIPRVKCCSRHEFVRGSRLG